MLLGLAEIIEIIETMHPVREGGQKLTKIYRKGEFDFYTTYGLNFHFPKKLNFFNHRKKFYGRLSRGYFFIILVFVLKKGGKFTRGV